MAQKLARDFRSVPAFHDLEIYSVRAIESNTVIALSADRFSRSRAKLCNKVATVPETSSYPSKSYGRTIRPGHSWIASPRNIPLRIP
ncbi:hypothetical protein ACHAWU_003971 [Discostella pseudostelligera]|uniref:Uncharacterized protein n=1 Tax=Discostella pseudostelligera TaxID=259834 RepID=A0ABD3MMP3_9STRA